MTTSFDDLVEQLLYDVALSGNQGIGADELNKAVKAFYQSTFKDSQRPATEGLLFSDAPPRTAAIVDDSLVEAVWGWLEKHPDVEVRTVESGPLSHESEASSAVNATTTTFQPVNANKRIFTTPERIWHIIAGHGIDYKRVPVKEFELLSIIAAHGPEGIIQPALTKLSQQDKRSVPKRTDQLAANGYISKEKVIAAHTQTTILKLWKFAKRKDAGPQLVRAFPEQSQQTDEQRIIYYDVWWKDTVRLLTENGGIIALEDLRLGLGVESGTWKVKAHSKCIERLVKAGLIRKLKAKVQADDFQSSPDSWIRCLQLLRDPADADRFAFLGTRSPDQKAKRKARNASALEVEEDEPLEDQGSENGDELTEEDEDEDDSEIAPSDPIPPQWTPDLQINSLIFDIVNKAGPDGISSMDLNNRAMGPLWGRPLDEVMLKLTDIWQTSQPPHLRHLTIVRDTGVQGKLAHYQYYSLPNFEKAVAAGKTEWKAVMGNQKTPVKPIGRPRLDRQNVGELDEWGFPKVDPRLFADKEGRASLFECSAAARNDIRLTNENEGIAPTSKGKAPLDWTPPDRSKRSSGKNPSLRVGLLNSKLDLESPSLKRKMSQQVLNEIEHGKKARRTAETLANAELNAVAEPTSPNSTESMTGSPQGLDGASPDDIASRGRRAHGHEPRIQEIEAEITTQSKPGVYVNTSSAKTRGFTDYSSFSWKPPSMVAVFKSDRLKNFEWFTTEESDVTASSYNIKKWSNIFSLDNQDDVDVEGGLPNKRQQLSSGVPKKRGRPTKAMIAERERLRLATIAAEREKSLNGSVEPAVVYSSAPDFAQQDERPSLIVKLALPRSSSTNNAIEEAVDTPITVTDGLDNPTEKTAHKESDQSLDHLMTPVSSSLQEPLIEKTETLAPSQRAKDGEGPNRWGTYSKKYKLAHPEIEWVHRGGGRWVPATTVQRSNATTDAPIVTEDVVSAGSGQLSSIVKLPLRSDELRNEEANPDPAIVQSASSDAHTPLKSNLDAPSPSFEPREPIANSASTTRAAASASIIAEDDSEAVTKPSRSSSGCCA